MSVPYDLIVTTAREKYLPNFFSVDVKYEYNGTMSFTVCWGMNQGDDLVHLHSITGMSLTDVIEEARRRCEWESGRSTERPVEIGDSPVIENLKISDVDKKITERGGLGSRKEAAGS